MLLCRRIFVLSFASFALPGCGSDEAPQASVVMVVDEGFDTTAAALDGKVLVGFSVKCDEVPGAPVPDGADLATRRASALAAMRAGLTACRLEEGISEKPPLLDDVTDLKEKWNAAVNNDDGFSLYLDREAFDRVADGLDRDLSEKLFHGTATAGLIAGEGSNVKVVLVERQLGSVESFEEAFECIDQKSVDQELELLKDPEFRAGLMALPADQVDIDVSRIVKEHKVEIVNESFGQSPRRALEKLQIQKKCLPIDLKPYFTVAAELDRLWEQSHPGPDVLTVIAAGNEGVEVTDAVDYSPCGATDIHVFVGSYKEIGTRADFSNFGNCVDVFAQGEDVIAPVPGDWLIPLAGTSFSAPLVARWLATHNQNNKQTLKQRRDLLLGLRNEARDLPVEFSPPALVYNPFRTAKSVAFPGMTPKQEASSIRRLVSPGRGRLPFHRLLQTSRLGR